MTEAADRIYLGSVQWGLPYGIANKTGQPGIPEVQKILDLAARAGIKGIDTAHAYGEAESVIGELATAASPFSIVTKTLPLRQSTLTAEHVAQACEGLHESLRRLRRDSLYGVLVHNAADLLVPGGDKLWKMLESFRNQGKVNKIGVSVYSPEELLSVAARYPLQLIQIPVNIYDQRFLRGVLDPLRAAGCEVHARSAFLQGLLLQLPDDLGSHFSPIRSHHRNLISYVDSTGHSMTSAAIRFVLGASCVDRIVMGFEKASQLQDVLELLDNGSDQPLSLDGFAIEREDILNPSLWKAS